MKIVTQKLLPFLIVLFLFSFCSSKTGRFCAVGSEDMILMMNRWSDLYAKEHAGDLMFYDGRGNQGGIESLYKGACPFAALTEKLSDLEKDKLKKKWGEPLIEIPVAMEILLIQVSKKNLTSEKDIFDDRSSNEKLNFYPPATNDRRVWLKKTAPHLFEKLNPMSFSGGEKTLADLAANDPKGVYLGRPDELSQNGRVVSIEGITLPLTENQVQKLSLRYPYQRYFYFYLLPSSSSTPAVAKKSSEFVRLIQSDNAKKLLKYYGLFSVSTH